MGLGEVQHDDLLCREALPAPLAVMCLWVDAHASTSYPFERAGSAPRGSLCHLALRTCGGQPDRSFNRPSQPISASGPACPSRSGGTVPPPGDSTEATRINQISSSMFGRVSWWQEVASATKRRLHVTAPQPSPRGHPKPLSPREQMVLAQIAEGRTNTEIAASLHLAHSTVKRYVSSIMWKLEAHTRREAVRQASKGDCSSHLTEEPMSA